MNYNKQKSLTHKEIDYINSINKIRFINITTYPEGNIHVEILWNFPIKITRNEDEFHFGKELRESNKENYWIVYPSNNTEGDFRFDFEVKQFKNIDKALKYGLTEYRKWLDKRILQVKDIKIT